ncbi:hypothetical protein [Aurantiacibacter aquimixticola]|uniref:Uncharacterized protein n=1 Tax=Aurantiacibacter aquimixticola TaxID=1958945 RepID=A0A419RQK9_9SPHN|nr:hypothetical protein [Aurantiacibacter aquimixticola]RJY08088.1 hypothetical protein D6201_00790 [Aurantiacibacter aquimixticola]
MFGPDTALVFDALQIASLAVAAGAGGAWLLMKRRASRNLRIIDEGQTGSLEERVRVLERIATDRPTELAEEIEALRSKSMETR